MVESGLTGRVRTPVGVWLPFTVDEVVAGTRWTWHVAGIPATGHRVDVVTAATSRLVIEVPPWAVAYAPVCLLGVRRLSALAARAA